MQVIEFCQPYAKSIVRIFIKYPERELFILKFGKINRKEEKRFHLPVILRRYKKADVFNEDMTDTFIPGEVKGSVVVVGNVNLLSKEEVVILIGGPSTPSGGSWTMNGTC